MGYIAIKCSLDSKLPIFSVCSNLNINILEVIGKTSLSKIAKFSTLAETQVLAKKAHKLPKCRLECELIFIYICSVTLLVRTRVILVG